MATRRNRSSSRPPVPVAGTRERILEAALRVLAARGLAGTTMREVAAEAGVATGLANYHFASKQALLLELIAICRARFLGELQTLAPSGSVSEVLRKLLEPCAELPAFMPGWFRLNADIDSLGLRDPDVQRAAAVNKQRGADDVHGYLRALAGQAGGAVSEATVRAVSDVAYAAIDGLAIRWLLDPSFDRFPAYVELERWLLARLAPGEQPPTAEWNRDPLAGLDPGPLGGATPRAAARSRARKKTKKGAR